ncbi:MAG: response regulator transcription factor [Roseitalea sp.]|uniref:DNA-binding response regulator n=1 Tax=Oceaniradius stylonematis TaxID=2184161 RepID=A0A3A8A834_9HYPH|nr:response regulator transcription factor [Oceaniradius stylonematis]MBO6553195.1 response regulator transcription factor [Roseitalea sp.]MBO6951045.1 response regulator transcription factor [Rhizobiaceae bacterium]RNC93913.1 MAG: DNA-binding response regulator [Oricola sp.]MBO6590968.1 response regulator transcription factor [Roseitalea sp.]MBO6599774.1 response regulator transcription factor [Roseitalea sp.]
MRILLVEDNAKLAAGMAAVLSAGGFQVDRVADGTDAEAALASTPFDLVVLDLSLPGMDGLDVLKNLRDRRLDVPVLIVTARGDLNDRVRGLDLGADDYLTKPFAVEELRARAAALIRRGAGRARPTIEFAGLTLDVTANTLVHAGAPIEISPRELAVLRVMLMSKSDVVPKAQIAESLSTFDLDVSDNAVEQTISRLRKRLGGFGIAIRAARGMGYFLMAQEQGGAG